MPMEREISSKKITMCFMSAFAIRTTLILTTIETAWFAFLSHSQDYASTIIYAISLGGDTDTIASMAGAISSAYLGIDAIPQEWVARLENKDYIQSLADKLWQIASNK
jgi:ADP-ribosylglycohydrolase